MVCRRILVCPYRAGERQAAFLVSLPLPVRGLAGAVFPVRILEEACCNKLYFLRALLRTVPDGDSERKSRAVATFRMPDLSGMCVRMPAQGRSLRQGRFYGLPFLAVLSTIATGFLRVSGRRSDSCGPFPCRCFMPINGIGRSGQTARQPPGNGFSKPLSALWRMHESLSDRRLAADLVSGRFFRDIHTIS